MKRKSPESDGGEDERVKTSEERELEGEERDMEGEEREGEGLDEYNEGDEEGGMKGNENKEGEDDNSKIERRKEVNRLAAQRSRKKKAELIQELGEKSRILREEIEQLGREKVELMREIADLEVYSLKHDPVRCKKKQDD